MLSPRVFIEIILSNKCNSKYKLFTSKDHLFVSVNYEQSWFFSFIFIYSRAEHSTLNINLNETLAAAAKLLQSCLILCDPIDSSPPGSPVPGILQARTLEWVAMSFSNAWKWKVKVKSLSRAQLLATPWTAAHQVPPSMGFSRQEYWSGLALRDYKCITNCMDLSNQITKEQLIVTGH